jgi:recombination protein RecR
MADAPVRFSSSTVETLVDQFARMPGIGRKTAQRQAFYILRVPQEDAERLIAAIRDAKERVGFCTTCGNIAEANPCRICADAQRDHSMICVVEQPVDVLAIERSGGFRGVYHVLRGALSPVDGVTADDLTIDALEARIARGGVEEVVLATNPTAGGEQTALYLSRLLKSSGVRVTRIARGVPIGADLEFSDQATLASAMAGRREM